MGAAVGLGVALGGAGMVTLLRNGERAETKRADRFAREQNLWLPPEFARAVGARVRRREGLGQLLSALVGAPTMGWYLTSLVHVPDVPDPGRIYFFPGPMAYAVLALPLGLVTVAVHVWDVALGGRAAVPPTAVPVPVRLAAVVPPWLTWISRLLAVLPPVAAAVVCALHARTAQTLMFAALAVFAGLAEWGVERAQLRLMNVPRAPEGGPELAFDEAFRASTVLSTVMIVPLLVTLVGSACCYSMNGAGPWLLALFDVWTGLGVLGAFVVNAIVSAPGVRRYYRRRLSSS
ncbi:hypothetical protein [Streptacidiphilus melanogenes]|uniref:hypothetical protein n=1 Tax=Streptacidiphilus melanogenes TaxID=411235 RepID=UPI0005AA7D40|nr:hypothetical protein [Streptacidiphilus melanogenes]